MPGSRLEISDVGQSFTRSDGSVHQVLEHCSINVDAGEFVSIVGPSGSGKTTLFNCISGLVLPRIGQIRIDGKDVTGPNPAVAYMQQKDLLMPWRTALENVTLGLEIRGVPRRSASKRATEYLRRYGLAGFENSYPRQLSGGMRQRVALIRTLVLDPHIVLLDEPFSALDYQVRLLLESEVVRILSETGCTTILVTHDIEEAISLSNRVIVLGGKPASVKSVHNVSLTTDGPRTPLSSREAPEFRNYHHKIWSDLDISLEAMAK